MRVGITCYPTYGGSGVVATEIGMELAERGHEVHFVTYANPIRLPVETPRIVYHEVEVSRYPLFRYPPYSLALASRIAEVAQEASLDVLHVHYAIPHSVSAMLASQMLGGKLPFITTLHGTDVTLVGADPSYLPITRFAIQSSPAVTCISHHLFKEVVRVFRTDRRIEVIPNFVNGAIYRPLDDPVLRARYADPEERLVTHLSNFRPVKRILDCIEVFARILRTVPSRLVMIGDGPDRQAAESLAAQLGIRDRVNFLGKLKNVAPLLGITDVLLLPSQMESFGLAVLEAMACGAVPIATNVGGVPEVVIDGVDGYLRPVGDTHGMAQAAESVLRDPDRMHRMSTAARRTALTRFGSESVVPMYESLYETVLQTG